MAQHELESEIGPHGQPMSEATDGRADPNFSGREWGYEAFHSTDYAAEALRLGPILLRREYPDMSDEQVERLKWGVRKVPAVPRGEEHNG